MTKNLKLVAIISVLMITIIACKKDNNSTPNNHSNNTDTTKDTTSNPLPIKEGTIKFKIAGDVLETSIEGHAVSYNPAKTALSITGSGMSGNNLFQITVTIVDCDGPGTYTMPLPSNDKAFNANALFTDGKHGGYECNARHDQAKGEVKVTDYVKGVSIKGTFKFTAIKVTTHGDGNAVEDFTEGEFNVKF